MRYFSTRNKNLSFSFKEIFLRGLAPDGGLFVPQKLKVYNSSELKELSKLKYTELAVEIISVFCTPDLEKSKLNALVEKSYKGFNLKDVVTIKKIGDINLLELYHGPTLAFKDIAMQVIGNIYNEFNSKDKKTINIIVATSGDTGSAAISALSGKPNINVFVLHPHNKISDIQRKIMTTVESKNIYNIALQGNFDDCQKIVKDMFADNKFREDINMSGVNSINWARIACQIVYYFYSSFKFPNKKINFSVPTGNFGDVYAGYVAKKMGLPINKLIVATNRNDILQRVINTGIYKPSKVEPSLSPSMDIQISSNFERLLFDVLNMSDSKVISLMNSLKFEGYFKLKKAEVDIPSNCPSCDSQLIWDADFLMCPNINSCPDQVVGKMIYFFKTLANNDGFGQATIKKLYDNGIRQVSDVYLLDIDQLISMGFACISKQKANHIAIIFIVIFIIFENV